MSETRVLIGGRAHTLEQIHEVGAMGYPFAEISLLDPVQVGAQLEEMARARTVYKMSYIAHYPNEGNPFDVKTLKEQFVPKMKRLFDLTHELDIHKGTIHFWIDTRWAAPEVVSEKIDLLTDMVAYAGQKDIVLCIENLTERYDSFMKAFDAIEDLRMTLDIGHAQLLASENTSFKFIEHVFEKIEHVHVHDNLGGTSVKDDVHLALGEGIIDYPAILTRLMEKGYDSTITMEVKPLDMKQTKEAIERCLK
jgi:sugar phosphate isomerase/epimerase